MIGQIRIAKESLGQGNLLIEKGSIFIVDILISPFDSMYMYIETNNGLRFPMHLIDTLSRPMNIWDKLKLILNI